MAKHNTTAITTVYRSPSSTETEFLEVFEEVLEEMNELNCDIITAGDFNINWYNKMVFINIKCNVCWMIMALHK